MHYSLVDRVVERTETGIVTLKHVSSAEEYLQDHFPGFPVLPGVMMLEAMVQAARVLLDPEDSAQRPWVLGKVKALKYGAFVRPGASLRVTVTMHADNGDGSVDLKGDVRLVEAGADFGGGDLPVACSGRLTMRPVVTAAGVG
jgi:3-hydroxyacyl-[acyl-carrier-protein] dehydratase